MLHGVKYKKLFELHGLTTGTLRMIRLLFHIDTGLERNDGELHTAVDANNKG